MEIVRILKAILVENGRRIKKEYEAILMANIKAKKLTRTTAEGGHLTTPTSNAPTINVLDTISSNAGVPGKPRRRKRIKEMVTQMAKRRRRWQQWI